jgi:hypothetical protein
MRRTVVGDESGDLLAVLDELDTDALSNGGVGLLGLNTDLAKSALFQHHPKPSTSTSSRATLRFVPFHPPIKGVALEPNHSPDSRPLSTCFRSSSPACQRTSSHPFVRKNPVALTFSRTIPFACELPPVGEVL